MAAVVEAVTGTFHYVTSHVEKYKPSDNEVAADTHGLQLRAVHRAIHLEMRMNWLIVCAFVFRR